ncbi:MAG TPA: hypothetical protein VFE89_13995 [Beijerinckiaceae bacterium]|nr:hypothetical protein [Beijerinckiaceae bacterium]
MYDYDLTCVLIALGGAGDQRYAMDMTNHGCSHGVFINTRKGPPGSGQSTNTTSSVNFLVTANVYPRASEKACGCGWNSASGHALRPAQVFGCAVIVRCICTQSKAALLPRRFAFALVGSPVTNKKNIAHRRLCGGFIASPPLDTAEICGHRLSASTPRNLTGQAHRLAAPPLDALLW